MEKLQPECTCHPDEAVVPCAYRYAASECQEVDEDSIPRQPRKQGDGLMKFTKVFLLVAVFLLGLEGLDRVAYMFDHPWFFGEAYLAAILALLVLAALGRTTYSILLYSPKAKADSHEL
jgi:hypothetical protein